jgi:integrase
MAKRKKAERQAWRNGSVRQRYSKYQVRWRENGQRMQSSGFDSRAEAMDELERIRARLKLGQPGAPAKPAVKPRGRRFAEYLDEFIEHRKSDGIRSASEDRARWQLHLAPALEAHTIDDLTSKALKGIVHDLLHPPVGSKGSDGKAKRPISGPTAHRVMTLLSAFYTWAEEEREMLTQNPARVVLRSTKTKRKLKSTHDGKKAPYLKSWGEVGRLYDALKKADAVVAMAYYISARAGLRPGEVIALRWGSVDIDGGTITVATQARKGYEGPTKSGKARTVPVVPALAAELRAWKESGAASGRGVADTDLVFPPPPPQKKFQTAIGTKPGSKWGRYLGRVQIKNALAVAFAETGIKPATWYEYGRHTFGSLSGLGGISTWRLKEIMGHQDISTTERYVSLQGQALTAAELAAMGA